MDAGWFEIVEDIDEGCPLGDDFEPDIHEPVTIGKGKNRQSMMLSPEEYRQENMRFFIRLGACDTKSISWTGYSLEIKPVFSELPATLTVTQQQSTYQAIKETGNQYRLKGTPDSKRPLVFEGKQLAFNYLSEISSPKVAVEINSRFYTTGSSKPKVGHAEIQDVSKEFLTQISLADLRTSDLKRLPDEWSLSLTEGRLTIDTRGDDCPPALRHSLLPELDIHCRKDNNDSQWIQLLSLDHGDDNGVSQDPLEYFFEDQVDILDQNEKPRKDAGYRILKSRPDERQLLLCKKVDRRKTPVLPSSSQLHVKVNTQALWRQKEAITNLKFAPSINQKPLLDLLKERSLQKWPEFSPVDESEIDWEILHNPDFDGCDKQREFVAKALATPDFAILDGPPGTGKTTTILELIVQLVRKGKRILLTASTHAAINNVLERVDENNLVNEVFPLRVGDENRATGVEHYQYDNLKAEFSRGLDANSIDRFMVESSNLVCGTTMGILRLFNNKDLKLESGDAPFDVMIIDECSKTTFAEFLLPARYAKGWVLVGDVKQLSPFTDREQITANLKQLALQHKSKIKEEVLLSPAVQRACFLLSELRSNRNGQWGYFDQLVIPVTSSELTAISAEIIARARTGNESFDQVLLVGHGHSSAVNSLSEGTLQSEPWHLYDYNVIFCEQGILDKYQEFMPADAAVLSSTWRTSAHNFRHMARYDGTHQFSLKGADKASQSFEIHRKWLDHDRKTCWADELVWRLEREYWLRFLTDKSGRSSSKSKGIEKQLKQLLPKSVNADGKVYGIRNMAFPSILEALSGSGILKQGRDVSNTMNQGFFPSEKQCRHTTLTYQHRMHPDISQYPREQFYSEDRENLSLLDGKQTYSAREWTYRKYSRHAIWLDVKGQNRGNANEREARAIIRELKQFSDWASEQSQNYDVAILTFYKKQESLLRTELQKLTAQKKSYARFNYKNVAIKLNTVDFFQGQEADMVFLSMVNTNRDGFLDSPNRLNVSVTRARFQLVVVGENNYFSQKSRSNELKALAQALPVIKE